MYVMAVNEGGINLSSHIFVTSERVLTLCLLMAGLSSANLYRDICCEQIESFVNFIAPMESDSSESRQITTSDASMDGWPEANLKLQRGMNLIMKKYLECVYM